MQSKTFTDFIQAHVEKSDPHRLFLNKTDIKKILQECDVPAPAVFQEAENVFGLTVKELPSRFVLKATDFSSKKGVFPLYGIGSKYIDLFTKEIRTAQEFLDKLQNVIGKSKSSVIVEEFVIGENGDVAIPFDYKFYTFDRGVEMILQIDRNVTPNGAALFDGEFNPLNAESVVIDTAYSSISQHRRPTNWKEMLSTANKVARHMNRPFVSVDMFTDGRRALVGEITPSPGGFYYGVMFFLTHKFDAFLGDRWREGCVQRGWEIPQITAPPPCRARQLATS
ncbi:ATP-grasp fold amidoligase family protein [Agrobacterium tumefaciens]|uniref:ATP-grasp domain-containing protein n=1 Tax=Agrobacterium tumefaciens TaxID=358 RepID=A0A176X3X5_AGRTU|nr:ATP-grasp fold amidoligase family protein [Agrobacterium tumefaciens]OAE40673.1 hypothetical protein A7J57_10465 [Agrobacterium tumefaciens]